MRLLTPFVCALATLFACVPPQPDTYRTTAGGLVEVPYGEDPPVAPLRSCGANDLSCSEDALTVSCVRGGYSNRCKFYFVEGCNQRATYIVGNREDFQLLGKSASAGSASNR